MRARSTALAQDEGSYLASVSDLMSGLMFIFIIALVTFALGLREQEDKAKQEKERLQGATEERRKLLERLQSDLQDAGIKVTIAPEQGVLRLGESLLFASGRADLSQEATKTVGKLAEVLARVLPCYATPLGSSMSIDCQGRGQAGRVDALFIEGHIDDVPLAVSAAFKDNWDLSAARSKTIFLALIGLSGGQLDELRNQDAQPVLGVSAYESRRGVEKNDSDEHRALNRRIDLRFVMVPPRELLPLPAAETERGLKQ